MCKRHAAQLGYNCGKVPLDHRPVPEKPRQAPGAGTIGVRNRRWLRAHADGGTVGSAFPSACSRRAAVTTAVTAAISTSVTCAVVIVMSSASEVSASMRWRAFMIVHPYSGMFPCFFGGWLARLVRSARNDLITDTRVAAGSITPSSSPRSAAKNGLATL